MALPRVLEPEVMDTEEEARDYDAMDHGEVNARFCEDLLAALAPARRDAAAPRRALDVGTGTALIPIELCRRDPGVEVDAIDLADHMLALAARNVTRARLEARIRVAKMDAKASPWAEGTFDVVMSNSIVHHIPEPGTMLAEAWRLVRRAGTLFVRDLERPSSEARVTELVAKHAPVPDAPAEVRAMHERQRGLFEASLRAALTADEVRAAVEPLGITGDAVRTTSDRHWTLACVKP
ncbi:MAG TPA: class I SAM-dependent methyltransferase [Polyangiaceae bacterium]|jgi:ubiquinone/menaquinone biosynthesis C-methylase UbiE